MDTTDIMQNLGPPTSTSGEAIRQIVQVFEDGCQAAAALRRTAESMSAPEIESRLNHIERRMMWEISTICARFARVDPPVQPVTVAAVSAYEPPEDGFGDLPRLPRN
jgi:hypothetical protein